MNNKEFYFYNVKIHLQFDNIYMNKIQMHQNNRFIKRAINLQYIDLG